MTAALFPNGLERLIEFEPRVSSRAAARAHAEYRALPVRAFIHRSA